MSQICLMVCTSRGRKGAFWIILQTNRWIRIRYVRCMRSIFWVFRLPGLCTSESRCRPLPVDAVKSRLSVTFISVHLYF